jgi:phenylacetic acid degradation operon negative regulatory protein
MREFVHRDHVRTPIGPSMQVALLLAETTSDLTWRALVAGWERWCSVNRFELRMKRLTRDGLLESTAKTSDLDGVVRLTESGRLAAMGGCDPERRWNRTWDGRWRIVLFDVPEKHRSTRVRLERQLRRARFGYLQDSVWITPDPVESLAVDLQGASIDLATLSILDARPCVGAKDADMVAGAWNFARINSLYSQHIQILSQAPKRLAGMPARRAWMTVEWHAWCRALRADPLLPTRLLPPDYRGRTAWEHRREKLRRFLGATA